MKILSTLSPAEKNLLTEIEESSQIHFYGFTHKKSTSHSRNCEETTSQGHILEYI